MVIGHARWLTTASGYLRLKLFDVRDLSSEQQASLDQVVQFIIIKSFLCQYLYYNKIIQFIIIINNY